MESKLIEQLEQGIFLENRNILIPWNIPLSELNTFQVPFKFSEPNSHEWEWSLDSCTILGGLKLQINKRYDKESGNEPLTSVGNSILAGGSYENSVSKFRELSKHFLNTFGEPSSMKKNEKAIWKVKQITILLYVWEKFDWFCGLQIYIGEYR